MTPELHHRVADLRSALNLRLYMLENGWLRGEKSAEAVRHVAQLRMGLYTMLSLGGTYPAADVIPLEPPARAV